MKIESFEDIDAWQEGKFLTKEQLDLGHWTLDSKHWASDKRMEPQRNTNATLVDLLDRVLDKGLVIHADLIVSVAGIPLIGVNLKAALAGMETMLKYGIMQAWDERTRTWEQKNRRKKEIFLLQGEEIILKMLGAYYSSEGIYTAWRYGHLYLTDEKLLLYHEDFGKVLFEIPLVKIRGLVIRKEKHFAEKEREELYLVLKENKVVRLSSLNIHQFKEALEKRMKELGCILEENPAIPIFQEGAVKFLNGEEQVICRGKMWYLMDGKGALNDTWSVGFLYLTDRRLCWYHDFEKRLVLDIFIDQLVASRLERRDLSASLKKRKVLDVIYGADNTRRLASFSGDALEEWNQIIKRIISGQDVFTKKDEIETCPQCGITALITDLLEMGCNGCGWVSPVKKERVQAELLA